MKRFLALVIVALLASAACGGKPLTNRRLATYAIGGALIAVVITAMVLSTSCNNCDNNNP